MPHKFTVAERISAADLSAAGLLECGPGCVIDAGAVFVPADALGTLRPVRLGARCFIASGAVVHGGVVLGDGAWAEEHVVVGKPERGFAVRNVYPGGRRRHRDRRGRGAALRRGRLRRGCHR